MQYNYNAALSNKSSKLLGNLLLLTTLLLLNITAAKAQSAPAEKKVDYLERIYFSGENKEGLNTQILVALQELYEKQPTPSLAKQVTYLVEIKDKANAADDACEVLELLAAGIYNIDAAEAVQQGIKMPSDKSKAKADDAISSLNKLNSTAGSLGNTAVNAGWSSYLLSGGKYTSFTSGAYKLGSTAHNIGNVAGTVGKAAETGKQIGELGKSLGINLKKKDSPCKSVPKKDIEIGERMNIVTNSTTTNGTVNDNSATQTTIISITNLTSGALRSLTDSIKAKPGVRSVEKSYSESLSTITVVHSGNTDALADWIEEKFSAKFKLVNYNSGKINLVPKS